MDLFCNEVCSFLNDLDYYIPCLLNKRALNIITRNVIQDINGIMLVGNEFGILNRIAQLIVKCLFDVDTLSIRHCPFNPNKENEGEYYLSDYHMEFELNEKALEFIKSIISNKSISKRQFVFIIKNAEPTINRNIYLALRRIMDINPTARFIITTSSTSFMEKSLMSRVLKAHCSFPFDNILQTDLLAQALKNRTHQEVYNIYLQSNFNIITLLQHLSSNCTDLLWQQTIDKLLVNVKKEKKHYDAIMLIRDTVYKLFHIGVPLKDICRYVIKVCNDNKNKNIQSIVAIAADCEHATTQGNKDILLYEKLFLNIYKHL
jgi:hypothetical protein